MPEPFDFSELPNRAHFASVVCHDDPIKHESMARHVRNYVNHHIMKRALTLADEYAYDPIACIVALDFYGPCLVPVHYDMSVPNGFEMASLCSRARFLHNKYRMVTELADRDFDAPLFQSTINKVASDEPEIVDTLRLAIEAKNSSQIGDYLYYTQVAALDQAKAYFRKFASLEECPDLDLRDFSPHPGRTFNAASLYLP